MYQAIRELRAAPGRTALITVTVGLIAVMVTFLSALAAGLGHRSTSALEGLLGDDEALIVADTGAPSLAASRLTSTQVRQVTAVNPGATVWSVGRARVGDEPVFVFPDATLRPGEVRMPDGIAWSGDAATLGGRTVTIVGSAGDIWWEHQPAVLAAPDVADEVAGDASAIVVDESGGRAVEVGGTVVKRGGDRADLSASNAGEQMSLGAMTTLLYVISALVVGAFFMVWTVQRMRGVAVTSALGASRAVLAADSLGQALVVLAVGVGGGVAITAALGTAVAAADVMPVVVDAATTVWPGLLLASTGLVGAAAALVPVLRVEPRDALAGA